MSYARANLLIMESRHVWPAVALAVASLAAVVVLAALGKDTTVILTALGVVVVPLLGGLLVGQVQRVRDQTNGNTSALLELVRGQQQIIASLPAAPESVVTQAIPTTSTGESVAEQRFSGPS